MLSASDPSNCVTPPLIGEIFAETDPPASSKRLRSRFILYLHCTGGLMTFPKKMSLAVLCLCVAQLQAQLTPAPQKNPLAEKPEAVKAGKKTFENSCQLCHGGDARGGRGPALATGNFQHGGEDWELYQSIR